MHLIHWTSIGQVEVSEWKLVKALDQSATVYAPDIMEIRIDSMVTDIGEVFTVHHVLRQPTSFSPNFLFQMSYFPSQKKLKKT